MNAAALRPRHTDPARFAAPPALDRLLRGGLAVELATTAACALGAAGDFAAFSRA